MGSSAQRREGRDMATQRELPNGKKSWTKAEIKQLLESSDRAVERGILEIYGRQTNQERMAYSSIVKNGAGFNSHDAAYFSKLAKVLQKPRAHLVKKDMYRARPRMLKYARQLKEIANSR